MKGMKNRKENISDRIKKIKKYYITEGIEIRFITEFTEAVVAVFGPMDSFSGPLLEKLFCDSPGKRLQHAIACPQPQENYINKRGSKRERNIMCMCLKCGNAARKPSINCQAL
jgi:hypothetical protein